MRSDFFVVSTPAADGERFAILWRDTFPVGPFLWSSSTGDWRHAFDRYLQTCPLVEEVQVRAELAEMGLAGDDVDEQIQRARDIHACNEKTTWESTTRIGFRNGQAQEVIRKTVLAGSSPFQRIYVLHCGECGHEYGANGDEVHARRCPQCQAGSPGLLISDIE